MVTIKMPKNYWQTLYFALDVAEDFYRLKFEDGFEKLFANAFAEKQINEVNCAPKYSEMLLNTLFPNGYKNVIGNIAHADFIHAMHMYFENGDDDYNLSVDELNRITPYIDFVIRMWLGQWGELQHIVSVCTYEDVTPVDSHFFMESDKEMKVTKCRQWMIPAFNAYRITGANASFGIYSDKLNDDIRILYGIYKAIRFAISGSSRDDEIVKGTDKQVVVKFPYVDSMIVESNEQAIEWLEKYPVPSFSGPVKSYVVDNGVVYAYIRDTLSIALAPGTKVFVNQNGRFDVERDGTLYNYRHKAII